MWLVWRIMPLCMVGIALWSVVPAMSAGTRGLSLKQTVTSINAANIANALQGDLGKAAAQDEPSAPPKVLKTQGDKVHLDGWSRPYRIRKTREQIEVISCGEDGECGTWDDIIEVVRADGRREQIKAGEQDRTAKPLKPKK